MAYFEFALAASIVAVILLIGVLVLVHEGKFFTAKEASAANSARLPLHFYDPRFYSAINPCGVHILGSCVRRSRAMSSASSLHRAIE
jgi:hypothetical protein